jgi:hypothetical protein
LTIEQNALTSFKSRTTHVPAFANTVGPGLWAAIKSLEEQMERSVVECNGRVCRCG